MPSKEDIDKKLHPKVIQINKYLYNIKYELI